MLNDFDHLLNGCFICGIDCSFLLYKSDQRTINTTPMKLSILFLAAIFLATNVHAQENEQPAIVCGKIRFAPDSIHPLQPYSVILIKEWPVTFQRYEQTLIDTTDFSFRISVDARELTYGNMMVNFFREIDSTDFERELYRASSKIPDEFFGKSYAPKILFAGLKFIIEPGDSLYVVVDYEQVDTAGRVQVHFTGPAGPDNNYQRATDRFNSYAKSFKLPLEKGLEYEDLLMEERLEKLERAGDSISGAYYRLLKHDIQFENLKMKHALIRASLYGPDMEIAKKRALARDHYAFMDTLNIRPEYTSSSQFRDFLGFYLEYLNRIITGRDIPYRSDEKSYWLSKAVFGSEVLKTFLYDRMEYEMRTPFFYFNELDRYEDYLRLFPGTPEAAFLTKIYNQHYPVSKGRKAPDLRLIDAEGKSKKISDLKGKVVVVSPGQTWLHAINNEQKTGRIAQLKRRFGDDLLFIALDLDFRRRDKFVSPLIDFYVVPGPDSGERNAFSFSRSDRYHFLIGRDGTIRDCVSDNRLEEKQISGLLAEEYTFLTRAGDALRQHGIAVIIFLAMIISVVLALLLVARVRHRRQQLQQKQLKSELKAIRSQLNPHFMFNSLNSIQNFINKSDATSANLYLSRFAQLMRSVIELSEKESITLREELDFNRTYIELEQLRYGFTFTFDIEATIDLYNIEIPGMIIQPFIENAIVHGMADLGAHGALNISVRELGDDRISIGIQDNGKGFSSEGKKGFGLKSSRERIDLLNAQNKEKIQLKISSHAEDQSTQGTTVQLIIPKRY